MSNLHGQIQVEADVLRSITREGTPGACLILVHASRLMQLATELADEESLQGIDLSEDFSPFRLYPRLPDSEAAS